MFFFTFLLLLAGAEAKDPPNPLSQMTGALEALTRKVSPAVVKILVSGYGPASEDDHDDTSLIARQHSLGSGVIVSPDGYIVTNAHVVRGAVRVRVALTPGTGKDGNSGTAMRTRYLDSKIVGVDQDRDVAVLKVTATGLPTLPLGDYSKLRQGQLVLAFGSPGGLENSVSMGLVSSVLRQPDPDKPFIYIQTDAAINPGNSGGPLVDVDGNVVGLNTFILTESGGSEGIGFAIPSVVVRFVYDEILRHGHPHLLSIGANLQSITPALASGLGLNRDWGVIVSDVIPDGPAEKAGLQVQDIVLSVDGRTLEGLPMFEAGLYRRSHDQPITVEVQRGSDKLTMTIPVQEERQSELDDVAALIKPEKGLVPGLGVLGIEINKKIADMIGDLRIESGVLVAARAAGSGADLEPGDIIHAVNGTPIVSLAVLRDVIGRLKAGDAAAVQVERDGKLIYVAFEIE